MVKLIVIVILIILICCYGMDNGNCDSSWWEDN